MKESLRDIIMFINELPRGKPRGIRIKNTEVRTQNKNKKTRFISLYLASDIIF